MGSYTVSFTASYIKNPNDKRLSFCFLFMTMLDNLEKELLAKTHQGSPDKTELLTLESQIRKVLSDYPRYYNTCLERELQRAKL